MWSHYASSHTGICLEFEIDRGGFLYQNLLPVQYKTKYPSIKLSNYNSEKRNLFTMHQHAICTKSYLWEYEHEWRAIVDTGAGLYPFDKKHLRKIIFGVNTAPETIEKVKEALQANGYTKTTLMRAYMRPASFGLDIKPL